MSAGITVYFADALLSTLPVNGQPGTPFSIAALYAQQHLGDPGPSGLLLPSADTTRELITLGAVSNAQIGIAAPFPSWLEVATEAEGWISLWDNITFGAGNCILTGQLTAAQSEQSGFTFTLNVLNFSLPVAS